MAKDKLQYNKGFKVKVNGKEITGHMIDKHDDYVIIHDAVTREHVKVMLKDVSATDVTEVSPTWLSVDIIVEGKADPLVVEENVTVKVPSLR